MGPCCQDGVCSPRGQEPGEGSPGHSLANWPLLQTWLGLPSAHSPESPARERGLNRPQLVLFSGSPAPLPHRGSLIRGQYFPVSCLSRLVGSTYTLPEGMSFLFTDTCRNLQHRDHGRQLDIQIYCRKVSKRRPNRDRGLVTTREAALLLLILLFLSDHVRLCSVTVCPGSVHLE